MKAKQCRRFASRMICRLFLAGIAGFLSYSLTACPVYAEKTAPDTLDRTQQHKPDLEEEIEKAMNSREDGPVLATEPHADWEALREGLYRARRGMEEASGEIARAMEDIDWEAIWDESQHAAQEAIGTIKQIEWEEVEYELDQLGRQLDSLIRELDRQIKGQ